MILPVDFMHKSPRNITYFPGRGSLHNWRTLCGRQSEP